MIQKHQQKHPDLRYPPMEQLLDDYKEASPFGKSMKTEIATSTFPNGSKAAVEQKLGSED